MENNSLPLYECVISDDLTEGIEFISIVDIPAMESNFIALENQSPAPVKLFTLAKQILTGVVAIPNKQIYRKDLDGSEYNIIFSEKTIEKMRDVFMKGNKNANINLNHSDSVSNHYVTEMWIVENPEMDKAKALGLNVPKGTLMASVKVDNNEVWNSEIESGNLKGFSLEGFFTQNLVKMQNQNIDMENQNNVVKPEQIDSKSIFDKIAEMFKSQSKQIIQLSSKKSKISSAKRFAFKGQILEIFNDGEIRQLDSQTKQFKFIADGEYVGAEGEVIKVIDGIAYEPDGMDDIASKVLYTKEGFELYLLPDGTVTSYSGRQIADGTYTLEDDTSIDIVGGMLKSADMTMEADTELAKNQDMENQQLQTELTQLKKQIADNQTQFVAMQKQLADNSQVIAKFDELVKSVSLAQTPNTNSENAPNQSQYTPSQQKKKGWANAFQNTNVTN